MKTAVIIGAGFSKNSGIPVLAEIPEYLVFKNNEGFDKNISRVLKKFMSDVFGYSEGLQAPALDDMFTSIDLAAGSGHHLGLDYPPQKLRTIRRMLVYKVYSIIEESFKHSEDVEKLIELIAQKSQKASFVVLNWDTVLEKYLGNIFPEAEINYCCGGTKLFHEVEKSINQQFEVIKLHGSANWLYCDNCRTLFIDSSDKVPIIKRAGFRLEDLEFFKDRVFGDCYNQEEYRQFCTLCGDTISSHIATFSFRKSFRANSFPSIWNAAEKALSEADKWIFIGYSLPESDYEVKHLLKISQLKTAHMRKDKPVIDVILLNSGDSIKNYEKFFGMHLHYLCNEGISGYLDYLQKEQ